MDGKKTKQFRYVGCPYQVGIHCERKLNLRFELQT